MRSRFAVSLLLSFSLLLFASGCKKKVPPAPPPPPPPPPTVPAPPPPPAAPTIQSFTAEPASVQRGQSATLRWSVQGSTDVSIDNGIGAVQATGTRQVFPGTSVTYTLTARSAGGERTATARVTVSEPPPPPPPPPPAAPKASLSERLSREIQDVYFDYDKYDVREDARTVLQRDSDALKAILQDFPGSVVTIEGHCDERGSAEYNLGLGDRRSNSAKDFLVQLGVSADRIKTISYGKERPQCTESTEDCWQKNRRVHFSTGQ